MLTHRSHRLLTTLGVLALAAAAMAAVPEFWRLESQGDFLSGDTDGVSIASDGTLSLAPSVQLLSEATDPHYWSLALGSSGEAYVGSGNEGRVYRIASRRRHDHAPRHGRDPGPRARRGSPGQRLRRNVAARHGLPDPSRRLERRDLRSGRPIHLGPRGRLAQQRPRGHGRQGEASTACPRPARARCSSRARSRTSSRSRSTTPTTSTPGPTRTVWCSTSTPSGATRVLYDSTFQEVRAVVTDTSGNVFVATVNGGSRAQNGGAPPPTPQESSLEPADGDGHDDDERHRHDHGGTAGLERRVERRRGRRQRRGLSHRKRRRGRRAMALAAGHARSRSRSPVTTA